MAEGERNAVDIIDDIYGVTTRTENSIVTASIGTGISQILKQDPTRLAVTLVNLSSNVIFVAPLEAVSATNGIRLDANGGSLSLTLRDDYTLCIAEWNAIASGAGSNLFGTQTLIAA